MNGIAEWPDTYAVCFKKRLTPGEVLAFQDVVRERITHPVKGEIKSAVLALARVWADKKPDSDNPNAYVAPPAPEDLVRQMIRSRHELAAKQSNRCEHCHNGWMSFRFHVHEAGDIQLDGKLGTCLHPADETDGMPTSCPCMCSQGEIIVSQLVTLGHDAGRIDKLRRAVMAARADWHQNRTEVAPSQKTDIDAAANKVQSARKVDLKGSDWP